jgi:hypothetical protein
MVSACVAALPDHADRGSRFGRHISVCYRDPTEKQATEPLGFPDANVISANFGIYLVDPVQRILLALLANCRNGTTLRRSALLSRLDRSDQDHLLAAHARAHRARHSEGGWRGRPTRQVRCQSTATYMPSNFSCAIAYASLPSSRFDTR